MLRTFKAKKKITTNIPHKGQLISKGLFKGFICTKNKRKYFCISALAYKKSSNQKSSVRESKLNSPISGIKCPYFFLFNLFLEARAEILEKMLVFWSNDDVKRTF